MDPNPPELKYSTAALRPPLNRWEVRFCQLLVDGNSRYEAYTQAGFPDKRSRNAVDQAALRLIKRVEIRAYLRRLSQEALGAAQVTADRVVQTLARQALAARRQLETCRHGVRRRRSSVRPTERRCEPVEDHAPAGLGPSGSGTRWRPGRGRRSRSARGSSSTRRRPRSGGGRPRP